MTTPYLKMMTDKELLHYAETMLDPVLSSPLEVELTKRLRELILKVERLGRLVVE